MLFTLTCLLIFLDIVAYMHDGHTHTLLNALGIFFTAICSCLISNCPYINITSLSLSFFPFFSRTQPQFHVPLSSLSYILLLRRLNSRGTIRRIAESQKQL